MKQELIELLRQASEICAANINNADNIDLHQMTEDLDCMIDQLNDIKKFEKFEHE